MRSIGVSTRIAAIALVAVFLTVETYEEARAFGFGFFFGGGHRGHRHHHRRGGGDEDRNATVNDGSEKRDAKSEKRKGKAILARTGDALFKSVVVSKGLAAVGVEEEINTSKIDVFRDNKRDYTAALAELLRMVDATSKRNSREGASFLAQGDVTQHALDRAVSKAYESSDLAVFEQFVGEQWTNERLRVAIIDRARSEVPGLLVGNNLQRVELAPLEEIIQRAGRSIYKRTLETSELIAVNQATARFTRALFETHGPLQSGDIREGVEQMLLAASRAALRDYDERFVRNEYGVILRYRAERILFDCLILNIEEIGGGKSKSATTERMVGKVDELSRGECKQWVVKAIGVPDKSEDRGDQTVIKPLPIRAVWVAAGPPKTDSSMFGQASNGL
jgi:hypothetical protein